MSGHGKLGPIVAVLAITASSCASPPKAEIDAATASVDSAAANRASEYAAASYKSAQEARAALDAEVKLQDDKWFKSYDRTRELAAAAKAAGDKASAEAAAAKEKAETLAAKRKADAAAKAKLAASAVQVGGQLRPPVKVKDVRPVYPPIALSARVGGSVMIQATIGPDGKVIDTKIVRSVPMLDQAAIDAVQQWEYTPTTRNGKPVPVLMTVTVNFTPR